MLIHGSESHTLTTEKDACDTCLSTANSYDKRYAVVAQGGTGRWCEVLWICDVCGAQHEARNPAVDIEKAREIANSAGDGWAEF